MLNPFKKLFSQKIKKNVVVIIDEDFYPKNENPHLENPFEEQWNGEKIFDVISHDLFLGNKEKFCKFYTEIREKYRKIKPSAKYHKALIELFKDCNLTIVNLGIDESFEKIGFNNVKHPKGVNSQLVCSESTFGCGRKFRFKEFTEKTVCKQCKESAHLKPNIEWFNEPVNFEDWEESKSACENADMIVFFGKNCNRTIVNTLLNLNKESVKVEVAAKTSDLAETEFHYVVIAADSVKGMVKLKELLPRYFKKQ